MWFGFNGSSGSLPDGKTRIIAESFTHAREILISRFYAVVAFSEANGERPGHRIGAVEKLPHFTRFERRELQAESVETQIGALVLYRGEDVGDLIGPRIGPAGGKLRRKAIRTILFDSNEG